MTQYPLLRMSAASIATEFQDFKGKISLNEHRFQAWLKPFVCAMKVWAATAHIPHGQDTGDYILKVYNGYIEIPALKDMQDEGRRLREEFNRLILLSKYSHEERVTRLPRDIEIANLEADLARACSRR